MYGLRKEDTKKIKPTKLQQQQKNSTRASTTHLVRKVTNIPCLYAFAS